MSAVRPTSDARISTYRRPLAGPRDLAEQPIGGRQRAGADAD